MGEYVISGGNALNGEVEINGAKNAVLPILAATVLNNGISVIHNCPKISDTLTAIEILKNIGCDITFEDKTIIVNSKNISKSELPACLVQKMRSSIIFMGSLIGRTKKVKISYPGGCLLGKRPIDIHIDALKKMSIKIEEDNNFIIAEAENINAINIELPFPSVGATENIMLAAILAKGTTIIKNAAREPEIYDLQLFLNKMGAKVIGAGNETITIEGVEKLYDVEHTVIPDRIEAGTYLCAAAITGGEINLKKIIPMHLLSILQKFTELGCIIKTENSSLYLKSPKKLNNIKITTTLPYPGFPTDMQPQLMSLLTTANGTSIIKEKIFEERNKHIEQLNKMNANILIKNSRTFIVRGVSNLSGCEVYAYDLRGGAALIIAGLAASGKTIVKNSIHIERGYENIVLNLTSLGADIKYIQK